MLPIVCVSNELVFIFIKIALYKRLDLANYNLARFSNSNAQTLDTVIGNHNCRIFRNQEYSVFGNKEYIGFGNKGAEKMATRNAEICRIKIPGNGTNPLFIKAYGLS